MNKRTEVVRSRAAQVARYAVRMIEQRVHRKAMRAEVLERVIEELSKSWLRRNQTNYRDTDVSAAIKREKRTRVNARRRIWGNARPKKVVMPDGTSTYVYPNGSIGLRQGK
jgi:hypothetical protein